MECFLLRFDFDGDEVLLNDVDLDSERELLRDDDDVVEEFVSCCSFFSYTERIKTKMIYLDLVFLCTQIAYPHITFDI